MLIAALKPGARDQALDLLQRSAAGGEPEPVTQRRGSSLSDRDAGASVHELINDPVRSTMLSPWLPLFDGPLHLARDAHFLERGGG